MITDLPPQIPNISTKPQYAAIVPHTPNQMVECIQNPNSKCRQGQSETGDFGGHFAVMTTANGTASEVTQNMVQFIPWEYPPPSQAIQFDYEAHQQEIEPEIRHVTDTKNE